MSEATVEIQKVPLDELYVKCVAFPDSGTVEIIKSNNSLTDVPDSFWVAYRILDAIFKHHSNRKEILRKTCEDSKSIVYQDFWSECLKVYMPEADCPLRKVVISLQNGRGDKRIYYDSATLLERGWSKSMITNFLGEADYALPDPKHHATKERTRRKKCYLIKRVEESENTDEFLRLAANKNVRREAALKAVRTKEKNLFNFVGDLEIEIDFPADLETMAISHARSLASNRRDERQAKQTMPDEHTQIRWQINYLRHKCTSYDEIIYSELFGKVGKVKAKFMLKAKVLKAIADVFPFWLPNCLSQLEWEMENNYALEDDFLSIVNEIFESN